MRLLTIVAVLALAGTASAERARSSSRFVANKHIGLGLELGEPVGFTGKVFIAPDRAIDFGVGDLGVYHPYYVGGSGLHLYVDHLWHPVAAHADAFELPLYIGVGLRFWNADYACDQFGNCLVTQLYGLRVPIGISFDFNRVPLDIFIQAVPTLDYYNNYTLQGRRTFYLDVDYSAGIRVWF